MASAVPDFRVSDYRTIRMPAHPNSTGLHPDMFEVDTGCLIALSQDLSDVNSNSCSRRSSAWNSRSGEVDVLTHDPLGNCDSPDISNNMNHRCSTAYNVLYKKFARCKLDAGDAVVQEKIQNPEMHVLDTLDGIMHSTYFLSDWNS